MTTRRHRLAFVSAVAVPYQVAFCRALQAHYEARFWFYEQPDRKRGSWWRVELGSNCRVLAPVYFAESGPLAERHFAPTLVNELEEFDPDIVMLGSFSQPSNYLAYLWAKRRGKSTVFFLERSRDGAGRLRKYGLAWRTLRFLYRDVDLVIVSAEDAVPQFRDEFRFGDRVVAGWYAVDLQAYFHHPLRQRKDAYVYLFANRMTEIYNPLVAIEAFAELRSRHPGSQLVMNAKGELGDSCRQLIQRLGIQDSVEFLTNVSTWQDLPRVYERCDVLLLPASFSNGNFTIQEAMASGMGIVISDKVLGVGKLIQDGHNGFCRAPTVEGVVSGVESYVRHPELFAQHAVINRASVEPFSAEGTARFFADVFSSRLGALGRR